jgi:hypothetical protein
LVILETLPPVEPSLGADEPQTAPAPAARVVRERPTAGTYALEIVEGTILEKGVKVPATVGHVMDALREMYPRVNIVASPEVTDLTLADLKLRPAEVEETLEALRVASGERFVWRRNDDQPAGIDPRTGLPVPARPVKDSSLYLLTGNPNTPAKAKREVEVFNLSGYIAYSTAHAGKQKTDEEAVAQSLRTVQDIVRETLELVYQQAGAGRLDYQFHSGADLLIVIGSRDDIEIARKVVEALPGQPVAVSARFRPEPGAGGPNPDLSDKQREGFMRRYGLLPQRPQTGGAENPKPDNPSPK